MALDLSSQLTLVFDETMVLHRILEIFTALFAPQTIVFWVLEDSAVTTTLTWPKTLPVPPSVPSTPVNAETTPAGFRLGIPYKETTIGIIEVDGLAFPVYRERYLSLALAVAGVCGLAVANARAHRMLETALADLKRENARNILLSDELQTINGQLEERVRQRTDELEHTLIQLREEIEQRKAAEGVIRDQLAEKTILLRELHHRVRNNFQFIISMLSMQARKVQDPALLLALSESRNRIRTMAAVHDKVSAAQDMSRIDLGGYVRFITSSLLSLYGVRPGQVTLSLAIPDMVIDINTAIPVGLILNEVVANSLKHAFPDGMQGEVFLEIRDEGASLSIVCRDNGVGMPQGYDWENPDRVGLLIVHSLVEQLQGTIEKVPGTGTQFHIRVQKVPGESGMVRGTYNQVAE